MRLMRLAPVVAFVYMALSADAAKPKPDDFPIKFRVLAASFISGQGCYMTLTDGTATTYDVAGVGMFHCTTFRTGDVLPGRIHKSGIWVSIFLLSVDAKGDPKQFEYVVKMRSQ